MSLGENYSSERDVSLSANKSLNGASSKTENSRRTIGLMIEGAAGRGGWYREAVWTGVSDAARNLDVNVISFAGGALENSPFHDYEAQRNVIYRLATAARLDGLIVSGSIGSYTSEAKFQKFCKEFWKDLPVVTLATRLPGIPCVLVDNHTGICELVKHLVQQHNKQRIAFIRGPIDNSEAEMRYQAYCDALEELKIPLDKSLVIVGDFLPASGSDAARQLLKNGKPRMDALMAANDYMALGALEELNANRVMVPEQVIVTGFDGMEDSLASDPPLTTVVQPVDRQARRAVETLLSLMENGKVSREKPLPTRLAIRQSCGCPDATVCSASFLENVEDKSFSLPAYETSLVESRKAVARSAADDLPEITRDQAHQLVDSLYASIKDGKPEGFLATLRKLLQLTSWEKEDLAAWQNVVSIIRGYLLPHVLKSDRLILAEGLLEQARVIVGNLAQQAQRSFKLHHEQLSEDLNAINQSLATSSKLDDLMEILAKGLARLGIPSGYVSRYENPGIPTGNCRCILAFQHPKGRIGLSSQDQVYPSSQLIPEGMLPNDRPYHLVVEPLHFRENQLGFAVLEVGPREGFVYDTLCGQLSSTLWEARLVGYLKSLSQSGIQVISLPDPQEILDNGLEMACRDVGAKSGQIALMDENGHPQRLNSESDREGTVGLTAKLPGSVVIAERVKDQEDPELIPDTSAVEEPAIQKMRALGTGAVACFPLMLRGKSMGVAWIYYSEPHHFSTTEVDALKIYLNQTAIAYDNARRMKELEHLHKAVRELAGAADVKKVLTQITESARDVLLADTVVIWPYDEVKEAFLPDELVACNVKAVVLEKFKKNKPREGGVAETVIRNGYLGITDLTDLRLAAIGADSGGLRGALDVASFQGIALKVDQEVLGVLYVNYKERRIFSREDQDTLETLAFHAALALKKARLLDQVRRAYDSARVVAEISSQGDLKGTLNAIVKGTLNAFRCDAITLYSYNQADKKLGYPPANDGLRYPDRVKRFTHVEVESIVYKMLDREEPYLAEDAPRDKYFEDRRFVIDEGIKSVMAIPLSAAGEKVGVMFVNYRTRHHFTGQEIADITLFASQAAIAIHNAQLSDERARRTHYLQALNETGKAVTSTLALDEIFDRIVQQVRAITGHSGEPAHRIHLGLVEEDKLVFKSWSPEGSGAGSGTTGIIDLTSDRKKSIMARAVKTKTSQLVSDVNQDEDYFAQDPYTQSELAVPIKMGDTVIGVINAEHPEIGAFDKEDQDGLEALAAPVAIAIQNARTYGALQRANGLVAGRTALAWMGMAASAWRHSADKYALTIRETAQLLRRDGERNQWIQSDPDANKRITIIEESATNILAKQITPPLSSESGLIDVSLTSLVGERARQLWHNPPYRDVQLALDLSLPDTTTVKANPEWLRRALDMLIDNSVKAVAGRKTQKITLATRRGLKGVEILVSDTGPGISREIVEKIGLVRIEKPADAAGLGMGLLITQTIIQTYGGNLRVENTSPEGTTMAIWLPVKGDQS